MTEFLAVAVGLLAVVTAFNLLLMFAVIRRLRAAATAVPPAATSVRSGQPAAGQQVAPFTARTLDGTDLSDSDLRTGTTVAVFLTATCPPCRDVAASLSTLDLAAQRLVVFVVDGGGEEASAFAATLPPAARVALVPIAGPVTRAFEVSLFPTVLVVLDGAVAFAGSRLPRIVPEGTTPADRPAAPSPVGKQLIDADR